MIKDRTLCLGGGSAVALTGFTTAALKGGVIDLGAAGYDCFGGSKGNPLPDNFGLNVVCDVVMNAASTIVIDFRTSTLEAMTGGTTSTLGYKSISSTTFAAGDTIAFIPMDPTIAIQRYCGMFVTMGTSLSTFSVMAWIGPRLETPVAPTNMKK